MRCPSLAMASSDTLNEKTTPEQTSVGTEIPAPNPVEAPEDDQLAETRSTSSKTVNAEKNDRLEEGGSEKANPPADDAQDENVIVVGWDSPDDPENPRK